MYNKLEPGEEKHKFAVCVKGLDFPDDDLSVRLGKYLTIYLSIHQSICLTIYQSINKFAVCVKGLDFPDDDLSVRLGEYLSILSSIFRFADYIKILAH